MLSNSLEDTLQFKGSDGTIAILIKDLKLLLKLFYLSLVEGHGWMIVMYTINNNKIEWLGSSTTKSVPLTLIKNEFPVIFVLSFLLLWVSWKPVKIFPIPMENQLGLNLMLVDCWSCNARNMFALYAGTSNIKQIGFLIDMFICSVTMVIMN